ncbi:hypothetical protein [Aestuariivivens sediminicola]|uniref:hypothetical protein n=1 Tax=Aestuariivivens sediminicola TaxID=2913560 RepID=UPI001F5704C2|nr:hypothetical protein [Aestuariivivens sediminicola]
MFKQRKHKTFSYKPRFIKTDEAHTQSDGRNKTDFISKWKANQSGKRRVSKGGLKLGTLILLLVLLLILMYALERKYM